MKVMLEGVESVSSSVVEEMFRPFPGQGEPQTLMGRQGREGA